MQGSENGWVVTIVLPWQRPPFWILSTCQKLPHTTVNIPTMFHEVWWKKSKSFLNPPFFYFYGNCGKVYHTDSNFFGLSRSTRCGCDRKHYLQNFVKFGVKLTFFAPWLPWQWPPFWIFFNPPKAATHCGGYSYKVSWS